MKNVLIGLGLGLLLTAAAAGGAFWMSERGRAADALADAGPLPSLTGPGGNSRYTPPAAEVTDDWIDEGRTEVRELEPPRAETDDSPLRVIDADADADPFADALAGIPELDADAPAGGGGGATPTAPPAFSPVNRIDPNAARPSLAVIPFKQSATVPEPEAGVTLANLLLSEIDSDRYTLFERSQLEALLQETRFQESDLVNSATRAAEFGKLAGIRYLIVGELSRLSRLRWTARVIDCQTGEIREKGSVSFDSFDQLNRVLPELVALLELNEALAGSPRVEAPRPDPVGAAPRRRQRLTGNELIDAFNPAAAFDITLETGEGKRAYAEGDPLSFRVTAPIDGFITLLTVDPAGDITLLLPNRWQPRAFVRGGQSVTLPTSEMGFRFTVQPPHGQTLVKAVVTTRPLRLLGVDPQRLQREGLIAGGNLADGIKAIRIAPAEGAPDAFAIEGVLEPHEWATAEMELTTSAARLANPAPPVPVHPITPIRPTPPIAVPVAVRPPLIPVTRGPDPNDAVLESWAAIVRGEGRTKSLGGPAANPKSGRMFPDAQPHEGVSGLLVVRREAAATKNLGGLAGNGPGYTTQRVALPTGTKTLGRGGWREQAKALRADPGVVTVVPDRQVRAFAVLPDTAFAGAQWALRNRANPGFDTAWHRVPGPLPSADRLPLIGVVDQGLDPEDPRLAALAWTNPREIPGNGRDDDGNGLVDDVHGYHFTRNSGDLKNPGAPFNHGSYVASIIACRPVGQANDLVGIAPGARIISGGGLAYSRELKTAVGSDQNIFDAIAYVADQGAKIINLSLGSGGDKTKPPHTAQDVADYNAHLLWDRLEREGVLVIVAAGNADTNNDTHPTLPGNLSTLRSNVITVMAIDPAGLRGRGYNPDAERWEAYSNYGKTSVHLAAPGTSVLGIPGPDATAAFDGTSFAAPVVTAAAALVWAQNPSWTHHQVKRALLESTRPVKGLENACVTGGILDLEAALNWRP